jgi:transposase-like protein
VVRNGYLPEREVLTGVGPLAVKVPKVRDRSGSGVKFNSAIVPPYVRKSPRVSAALPWLYLKGISTGDMSDALQVLLGKEAKGLSANVVSRLKAQWAESNSNGAVWICCKHGTCIGGPTAFTPGYEANNRKDSACW